MFWGCFKGLLGVFYGCFTDVLRLFWECLGGVLGSFWGGFGAVFEGRRPKNAQKRKTHMIRRYGNAHILITKIMKISEEQNKSGYRRHDVFC